MRSWVDMSGGQVPHGAIVGGTDYSGEHLYVARAMHQGSMVPGKLVPSHGCAYISWGGEEHRKPDYQVLVGGSSEWVAVKDGNIPNGAFQGGMTENGEALYVGRIHHDSGKTTGKVQRSHGCCYIPFNGKEHKYNEYDVLLA